MATNMTQITQAAGRGHTLYKPSPYFSKHHTTKVYGGVKVQLDGLTPVNEWSVSCPPCLNLVEGALVFTTSEAGYFPQPVRTIRRGKKNLLYCQKLALTSPTGGGRSVGIARSRAKATEF